MSELGRRLRTLRQERGLRLDDIAAQTGLSKAYLSDIERGRRATFDGTVGTINRILAVYGLELVVEVRERPQVAGGSKEA